MAFKILSLLLALAVMGAHSSHGENHAVVTQATPTGHNQMNIVSSGRETYMGPDGMVIKTNSPYDYFKVDTKTNTITTPNEVTYINRDGTVTRTVKAKKGLNVVPSNGGNVVSVNGKTYVSDGGLSIVTNKGPNSGVENHDGVEDSKPRGRSEQPAGHFYRHNKNYQPLRETLEDNDDIVQDVGEYPANRQLPQSQYSTYREDDAIVQDLRPQYPTNRQDIPTQNPTNRYPTDTYRTNGYRTYTHQNNGYPSNSYDGRRREPYGTYMGPDGMRIVTPNGVTEMGAHGLHVITPNSETIMSDGRLIQSTRGSSRAESNGGNIVSVNGRTYVSDGSLNVVSSKSSRSPVTENYMTGYKDSGVKRLVDRDGSEEWVVHAAVDRGRQRS